VSPKEYELTPNNQNNDKKVKFSISKRSLSIDPSVASKIRRPIRSNVYQKYTETPQQVNVINHN
jgi:hypothetical protein